MARLTINGVTKDIDVDPNTPLLWVIREQMGLTGTKYGCGLAQCGACTVHIDGAPTNKGSSLVFCLVRAGGGGHQSGSAQTGAGVLPRDERRQAFRCVQGIRIRRVKCSRGRQQQCELGLAKP
jgi:hypothetical protein